MNVTGRRILCLSALVAAACSASAAPASTIHVTIVHTNDLHGYVENAPAVAAVEREVKSKNPNTLFLDAGDAVSGTPISTMFRGEPCFAVMSLMGYDAAALGNHEFDYGLKQLVKFRELAGHPLLCANVRGVDGKPLGDDAYRVFTVGGVRIGVVGLLTDEMPRLTTTENWAGCTVEAPLDAAKRLVPEVRKKSDVVVLLTHVGVEVDAAIAGAVPGIDLVVGGHTHTELKRPIFVPCGDRRVPVVQAKCHGERVGIVDFDWDPATKSVVGLTGRLVTIDRATMPEAPDVKTVVDEWTTKASAKTDLSEVIGKTDVKLTREKLRDALERIFADVLGAEFGYENLHGVRADVQAGDIRVEDVWRVLPFDDVLVKIRLRGAQIPDFARRRLGRSFDSTKTYVFATNSYVADQQKKYLGVEGAPVEKTDLSMRDAVVDWVRKHKGFPTADAPGRGGDEPGGNR